MASIRFEDRLDGVSNYLQWKVRISAVLKENKIWRFVDFVVTLPLDPVSRDIHDVLEARAQRIILDGVKDCLIPHLAEKKTTKDMWNTLLNLYEAKNENRKMTLRDKLHFVTMSEGETVVSYLTNVAQVKDELVVGGDLVPDSELVRIALKGFTKEWSAFVKGVVAREKLPEWSRLWDDFTQEEIRESSLSKTVVVSEENVALAAKGHQKKKRSTVDINKVRCYSCNNLGHYAALCPNKKGKKEQGQQPETLAIVAEFLEKFDREFALVTRDSLPGSNCHSNEPRWFVDSGATRHMTGMLEAFHSIYYGIERGLFVNGTQEYQRSWDSSLQARC